MRSWVAPFSAINRLPWSHTLVGGQFALVTGVRDVTAVTNVTGVTGVTQAECHKCAEIG